MCCRAFVRLNRVSVPAKHRQQRCKRQDDYDVAANAVNLRWHERILTYPAASRHAQPSRRLKRVGQKKRLLRRYLGQNLPVDAQRPDVWNFAGNHWHQTALWTINSGPNEKSLKPSYILPWL